MEYGVLMRDTQVARISPTRSSVLDRTLDIIEGFGSDERTLTLAELARRTSLPKPTVHRLIGQLVDRGFLSRTPDGRFTLGMRLFEVGARVPFPRQLRHLALPVMEHLFEALHETVHLAVLDGFEVLYLERLSGHGAETPQTTRAGGRLPAHACAPGKALLAFSPCSAVENLPVLRRIGPRTVTQPHLIQQQFETIRRDGVAIDYEESMRGICCVAAPIMNLATVCPIGAVSVSGPVHRLDVGRSTAAVRRAARDISLAAAGSILPAAI
jgi:IclR family transcriptional regulator, acetate operon repressor